MPDQHDVAVAMCLQQRAQLRRIEAGREQRLLAYLHLERLRDQRRRLRRAR